MALSIKAGFYFEQVLLLTLYIKTRIRDHKQGKLANIAKIVLRTFALLVTKSHQNNPHNHHDGKTFGMFLISVLFCAFDFWCNLVIKDTISFYVTSLYSNGVFSLFGP